MPGLPGESVGQISEAIAKGAFYDTSLVLTEAEGMDINAGLAELAGGADSYNALVVASEDFIRRHPRIYEGRAPSPFVMGLWIGMVAGARASQQAQERQ